MSMYSQTRADALWTVDDFKGSWGDELNRPIMRELAGRRLVFHRFNRESPVVTFTEEQASSRRSASERHSGLA